MVTVQMENKGKLFDELRRIDDYQGTDIALLDESDIAGASLNGKSMSEREKNISYREDTTEDTKSTLCEGDSKIPPLN